MCVPKTCGNGVFDAGPAGEECDGTPHCNTVCKCASGFIPDPENPGYCKAPQVCGNMVLEGTEECELVSRFCDGTTCTCMSGYVPDPANPGYCMFVATTTTSTTTTTTTPTTTIPPEVCLLLTHAQCDLTAGCYWCASQQVCYPFPDCPTCESMPQEICLEFPGCQWCSTVEACYLGSTTCPTTTTTSTTTSTTINHPPIAYNQSLTVVEDRNLSITLLASDPDNDSFPYWWPWVNPSHGTLHAPNSPNWVYTPSLHYIGTDSFQFKVADSHSAQGLGYVWINITPNHGPVLANLSLSTTEDTPLAITLQASDPDGDLIAYWWPWVNPSHGTLHAPINPNWTYTPYLHYVGTDSFQYKASDAYSKQGNIGTVSITVTPVCGNGIVSSGEECDGGTNCNVDCTCPADMVPDGSGGCAYPVCGNGIVEQGEQCDGAQKHDSGIDVCWADANGNSWNRMDICQNCSWFDNGHANDTLSQNCGSFDCTGAGICLLSCTADADCNTDYHCDGGMCFANLAVGGACDENSDCISGYCRTDWDGAGMFCAQSPTSCVDDDSGTINQFVNNWVECDGTDKYRVCNNGIWSSASAECDAATCNTGCGYVTDADNSCISGMGLGTYGGCELNLGSGYTCVDCGELTAYAGGCNSGLSACSTACGATCQQGQTTDSGLNVCWADANGNSWNRIDVCGISGSDCLWTDNGHTDDTLSQDCGSYDCTGAGACLTSCTSGAECNAGYYCHCDTNTCSSTQPVEICDGVDNDCDGQVDEYGASGAPTWYRDADCDGYGTDIDTFTACSPPPSYISVSGDCDDSTAAINPGAVEVCDGRDDNCDGRIDEGVTSTSTCGVGACYKSVTQTCNAGEWVPACTPGTPAPETCNGVDDDCDGRTDEGLTQATSCGVGVCSATGQLVCVNGQTQDTCTPGQPAGADDDCNGVDDNCNGIADDNYVPTATSCGLGVCAASGDLICVNGAIQDTCVVGQPTGADDDCNAVDNDCDGISDEHYVALATSCGVGVCAAVGQLVCVNGQTQNTCVPGQPTSADTECNGLDDDCDGVVDDGYAATATSCGVGACSAAGQLVCVGGGLQDTCVPSAPSAEACNGVDDDCDGTTDEGLTFDADNDGYSTSGSCFGTRNDCNDNNAAINPGTFEIPGNSVDENCDAVVGCSPQSVWKNHGAYVSCVSKDAEKLLLQGLITQAQKDAITSAAAKTNIGKK